MRVFLSRCAEGRVLVRVSIPRSIFVGATDKPFTSSHTDTAQFYGNEKEVGEAVRQSGLNRSNVFITTKVMNASGGMEKTYQSVLDSVKKIDGENGSVDLFLIHTPSGDKATRKEMWLALEKLSRGL
jgi:diketogulonate reductase-like aldo/keto reductase